MLSRQQYRTTSVPRAAGIALLVMPIFIAGCGGGGGGGGGGGSGSFALSEASYGRLVDDGTGPRLVSPLTTATIDPITGLLVPGSLETLSPAVDVDAPQSLGLGSDYLPRVVPRNGVIELEFTTAIDATTVTADVGDATGNVVTAGSVQVRTEDDKVVPVELSVHDGRRLWIDPVSANTIGLPPSPVVFGPAGDARASATGYLRIKLPRTGSAILRSMDGTFLAARKDGLGDDATPIGINPGNVVLDFIAQNQLLPTDETFNGFLPDARAPRIVRVHTYGKALDFGAGDGSTATTLTDASAGFSTFAKNGLGEWAGARLIVRPGTATEETWNVSGNTRTTVTILGQFALAPQDGDVYRLERSELYEPDLNNPIEPALFDPNNPENPRNENLVNFVEVWEIDPAGNRVANAPTSLSAAVPSFSELRMRFSEPMAVESFLQWETFRVAFAPDSQGEILCDATLDVTQSVAIIRPYRFDQVAGTFEVVGWGKGSKNLQLILTTVPKTSFLRQHMSSDDVTAFLDLGVRSLTDLGGQPLAFPAALFSSTTPQLRFVAPFTSTETSITQIPPPVVQSWGVIVHRMQGRPLTGIDPATGEPGVNFRDQINYYRPIGDVNLQTNGYLAGSPVVYSTKIHDDFFPPPHGQFGKFPLGVPQPLTSPPYPNVLGPHDGARFQTVWRDIDASPSRDALAGTLLDLYRVSWAPIGGNVATDNYDNVSIHCAHAPLRPRTTNNGASASYPQSGLAQPFDYDTFIGLLDGTNPPPCPKACGQAAQPNYWDTLVTCVQPGTTYKISQSNLFAPPFDGNAYHAWPDFDTRFQYNNGDIPQAEKDLRTSVNAQYTCGGQPWTDDRKFSSDPNQDNFGGDSLLFEVRIRPQTTAISGVNGFTMAIGVLIDSVPYFRIFTMGTPGLTVDPDDINSTTNDYARCATGRTDPPPPPGNWPMGDNSRYFTVLDYVKTTSIITSPWVRVVPSNTIDPDYFPAVYYPPLDVQPAGTSVLFEFAGANGVAGSGATPFSTDINVADKKLNVAFKAKLVGNITSLLLPNFDTVAIPFLRPFGT